MQVGWNEVIKRFQSSHIWDLKATLLEDDQVFGPQIFHHTVHVNRRQTEHVGEVELG